MSKRSNACGMRAGFIAGDENIIKNYKLLVSNGASPVPIPIQKVASALYDDDNHQIKACLHYDKNFEIVEKYLIQILNTGSQKAQKISTKVLEEVYEVTGLTL